MPYANELWVELIGYFEKQIYTSNVMTARCEEKKMKWNENGKVQREENNKKRNKTVAVQINYQSALFFLNLIDAHKILVWEYR